MLDQARKTRTGVISTQILQEYFVTVTRKLGVEPPLAKARMELFARLEVVQVSVEPIFTAVDRHRLQKYQFWDSLLIQAAIEARCSVLYTEDLHHGQKISGLRIINPFLKVDWARAAAP